MRTAGFLVALISVIVFKTNATRFHHHGGHFKKPIEAFVRVPSPSASESTIDAADQCVTNKDLQCDQNALYRTIDGSCNNLQFPSWGQANTSLTRLAPAQFQDVMIFSVAPWSHGYCRTKPPPYAASRFFFIYGRKLARFLYFTLKIPGPSLYELIRVHAKSLLSDEFATYVWKLCDAYKYKPWGIWTPNANFVIFVSNCETISEVFKSKSMTDKPRMFYKPMSRYLGRALFTVNGETYRKQRKRAAVVFRKPVVESLLSTMNTRMKMLVGQLQDKADGRDIDIHALVEDHFWVATTSSYISITVPDDESRLFMKAIRDGMELVQLESVNPLYYWLVHKWKIRHTESNMYEALRIGKKIVPAEKSLYMGPRGEEVTASAGQALLKEYTKLDESDADQELFDQALTLMAANHETTSFAVNILLMMLALHQDVQQKVYEEIELILGDSDRPVETTDLARMDYMEMAIKETLRLFPPAPLMARKVKEDTELSGVLVPKGSIVVVNAMAVQRNPENCPDPLHFDPMRFSPEASIGRHPYAFIPFSSGTRNCPGQLQAYLMMKTFLCSMLRNFKVLPGENLHSIEGIRTRMCVTLRLCEPLLRLTHRKETYSQKEECVEPA